MILSLQMPVSQSASVLVLATLVLVGVASAGILENAASALNCPQNLLVAREIDNKDFMRKQINCILGPDSVCDEVGLKAKRKPQHNFIS